MVALMDGETGRLFTTASVPGRATPGDGPPVREWPVLRRLEKGQIGTRADDGSVSVRRRERADTLLFGPFWRLPCGRYRLTFRCRAERPRMLAQPVLGVEIIVLNRDQQGWRDFTAAELAGGDAAVEFEVPPELSLEAGEVTPFEFRFLHLRNADLAIDMVELRQLDDGEAEPLRPRRWRLLGRQWPSLRARRTTPGGITAARGVPAGTILQGGRPYLWLPEGSYRLDLSGRAAAPRHSDAPVVAVEVTAHPLSHRSGEIGARRDSVLIGAADFTAGELAAGTGTLAFAVPRELGLDGGEDVPFQFRILHLGNAGLTIEGVEVTALNRAAAEPAPTHWRLLGRLRHSGPRRLEPAFPVRRDEPPGEVLGSARPRPRLNAGEYRLSLDATAENPRDADSPVLGIEVSALLAPSSTEPLLRRRVLPLLHQEFRAADLAAGRVEAVFSLPAQALAGDSAFCDIRFYHRGNADLRLGPVELREERVPETPGSARMPVARRNVLVIGNCQAETIRRGFEEAEPLRRRFKSKYQFVGLPKHLHQRGIAELRECDLLLVQDIRDWESYPLKDEIPDGIEIVRFPLLHFASLWPFDHWNGPGDKEAHDREYPNLTFLYLDGLLGRLRKEIPDKEERFQAYRDLTVPDIVNHVRLHDFERRRLLAMDQRFGGGIGQFVLDNFQARQLFYTIAHPNREVLSMLMQRLLHLLGIDERFPEIAEFDHLKRLQVPIHPKVARDLGVGWADEDKLYSYEGRSITWEAYTRSYIEHYG